MYILNLDFLQIYPYFNFDITLVGTMAIQEQVRIIGFSHAMFANTGLFEFYTITIIGQINILNISIEW